VEILDLSRLDLRRIRWKRETRARASGDRSAADRCRFVNEMTSCAHPVCIARQLSSQAVTARARSSALRVLFTSPTTHPYKHHRLPSRIAAFSRWLTVPLRSRHRDDRHLSLRKRLRHNKLTLKRKRDAPVAPSATEIARTARRISTSTRTIARVDPLTDSID